MSTLVGWATGWQVAVRPRSIDMESRLTPSTSARRGACPIGPTPLRNYRDFLETRPELFAASYPWLLNRGIFMTPGDEEQWTLSVQHTEADIDRYVEVFTEFCGELTR